MAIPKLDALANQSSGVKKIIKPLLIGVLALLLGAFGLEATNNDWDLGKLLAGESAQEAKVKRDANGDFLLESCKPELYDCKNFKIQPEAQEIFAKCGGKGDDVNGLDGDNDGIACESLPSSDK